MVVNLAVADGAQLVAVSGGFSRGVLRHEYHPNLFPLLFMFLSFQRVEQLLPIISGWF